MRVSVSSSISGEKNGRLQGVMLRAGSQRIGLSQDDWKKGRDRKKGVGLRMYIETTQNVDGIAARQRPPALRSIASHTKRSGRAAHSRSRIRPDSFSPFPRRRSIEALLTCHLKFDIERRGGTRQLHTLEERWMVGFDPKGRLFCRATDHTAHNAHRCRSTSKLSRPRRRRR